MSLFLFGAFIGSGSASASALRHHDIIQVQKFSDWINAFNFEIGVFKIHLLWSVDC
jgi:hypothetical protein